MSRLFVRIYLGVVLALLIVGLLIRVLVSRNVDAQIARTIEQVLAAPVAEIARRLVEDRARGVELAAALAQTSRSLGCPAALRPRGELRLPERQLRRIDQGEIVGVANGRRPMVYVPLGGGQLLVLGPMPPVGPGPEGRLGVALPLLLAGLLVSLYLLVRPLERRLTALGRTAASFGQGALEVRAEIGSRDAIGVLASDFNRMAERIERLIVDQQELLRVVSHELRTPIQRLHFGIEGVQEADQAAERERLLPRMLRDLEELEQLIDELLTYARLRDYVPPVQSQVDLHPVLGELVEALAGSRAGVLLVNERARGPIIGRIEPRLFRRAVSNLVVNALRHARSRVELRAEQAGQEVLIYVDDDGPGVPGPERERIFEPFQRIEDEAAPHAAGFGLGLAIVRRVATCHGGGVTVGTSGLGGASFRLSFFGEQISGDGGALVPQPSPSCATDSCRACSATLASLPALSRR